MSHPVGKNGNGTPGAITEVDGRARKRGRMVAESLEGSVCQVITGPSHSGKTQAAIAARALVDPGGTRSVHTSAAVLATNAHQAPGDRSARWQSWDEVVAVKSPRLVVIDEAGSRGPPSPPLDVHEALAKRTILEWARQGAKFILVGHRTNAELTAWNAWLLSCAPSQVE